MNSISNKDDNTILIKDLVLSIEKLNMIQQNEIFILLKNNNVNYTQNNNGIYINLTNI